MNWILNVLVSIDQLGNAIAGGNPDATISARVGYFSETGDCSFRQYWELLRRIIDFTFYPIDGPNHCVNAYLADPESVKPGNDLARAFLGIIVIVSCIFLALAIRLAVLIIPSWQYKSKEPIVINQSS